MKLQVNTDSGIEANRALTLTIDTTVLFATTTQPSGRTAADMLTRPVRCNQLVMRRGDVTDCVSEAIAEQLFQYDRVFASCVVGGERCSGVEDALGLRADCLDLVAQVDVSADNEVGIDDGDIRFVTTGLIDRGGRRGGLGDHQQVIFAPKDGRDPFANQNVTVDDENPSCSRSRSRDHLVCGRTLFMDPPSLDGRGSDSDLGPLVGRASNEAGPAMRSRVEGGRGGPDGQY